MVDKKLRRLNMRQKSALTGLLFISPWLIGFLWFFVRELVMAIQFSLSEMNMGDHGYTLQFVGLKNFQFALLKDATFNQLLVESVQEILLRVPIVLFFSLFMAILVNKKFKGRTLVRAILFLPIVMNAGAVREALNTAMEATSGGITATAGVLESAASSGVNVGYYMELLGDIGVPINLMEYIINAVAEIYDVVSLSSVQIIIFISALQSIPTSYYEVARIEGATAYETFWKVTFPLVSPFILTNMVYTVVDSFIDSTVVERAYEMAFTQFQWGISAAMNLISSLSICLILLIASILISKKVFYQN